MGPFQKGGQRPGPASGAKATGLQGALARKTRGCRGTLCGGVPNAVLIMSQKGPELVPVVVAAADAGERSRTWAPAECSTGRRLWVCPALPRPRTSTEPLETVHSGVSSPVPSSGRPLPVGTSTWLCPGSRPHLSWPWPALPMRLLRGPQGMAKPMPSSPRHRDGLAALCVRRCVSSIPAGPGGEEGHRGQSPGTCAPCTCPRARAAVLSFIFFFLKKILLDVLG